MAVSPDPIRTPERIAWADLEELLFFEHEPGDHIAVIGPTDSGKTTLAVAIVKTLARRRATDGRPARVVVFVTKPVAKAITALGWPIIKRWPPKMGEEHCVVWPPYGNPHTATERQRRVFRPLMATIFAEGGQTVFIDEIMDFEEPYPDGLGLKSMVKQWWTKARELELTLVGATQRPRGVGRAMWSEPKWLFIFRLHDQDDLKRVGDIGGDTKSIRTAVNELDEYEFLLVRRQGKVYPLYVSKVELE